MPPMYVAIIMIISTGIMMFAIHKFKTQNSKLLFDLTKATNSLILANESLVKSNKLLEQSSNILSAEIELSKTYEDKIVALNQELDMVYKTVNIIQNMFDIANKDLKTNIPQVPLKRKTDNTASVKHILSKCKDELAKTNAAKFVIMSKHELDKIGIRAPIVQNGPNDSLDLILKSKGVEFLISFSQSRCEIIGSGNTGEYRRNIEFSEFDLNEVVSWFTKNV